jgi:hypothetical protein
MEAVIRRPERHEHDLVQAVVQTVAAGWQANREYPHERFPVTMLEMCKSTLRLL